MGTDYVSDTKRQQGSRKCILVDYDPRCKHEKTKTVDSTTLCATLPVFTTTLRHRFEISGGTSTFNIIISIEKKRQKYRLIDEQIG